MTQEGNLDDAVMQQAMQTSSHIENLEARNITLKQREDENKLSFQKNNNRLQNIQSTGIIEEFDEGIMSA